MSSKDKFNAEKWESIDDTASSMPIKYEFEDAEGVSETTTETKVQGDDTQSNSALLQENTSNNEPLSKTIKKWIKRVACIALCLGLLSFLGILSVNRINSTCDTYEGDYSSSSSTVFTFGDKTIVIGKDTKLEDLDLSGFSDINYCCDYIESDINSTWEELPSGYKLSYLEYIKGKNFGVGGRDSIRCIISENDCDLELLLSFDDIPEEDFPISITKGRIVSVRLQSWHEYGYNNGYSVNGVSMQSKAKDALRLMGEPKKRNDTFYEQCYVYSNSIGQTVDIRFDIYGRVTHIWVDM